MKRVEYRFPLPYKTQADKDTAKAFENALRDVGGGMYARLECNRKDGEANLIFGREYDLPELVS